MLGQFAALRGDTLRNIPDIIYTERQKSCSTFSLDFFLLKIDDLKNRCSLVFMPVQRTIDAEKSVQEIIPTFLREKCKINFWAENVFIQTTVYMLSV